jgi:triacylglycerol lipase
MKGLHSTFSQILKCASLCGLFIFSQPSFAASNHSAATAQPAILKNYLVQERKAAGLSSKTVQIGNITWSYNEGGSRANPSILLIHGLAGNRDNWNRVAHYLTPYYHVIIPDLPTNGDTQVPENFDISIPNVTEQLRQFVEKIDIEDRLNVAGHSLGGSIATVYAAQYPFDTQSLFLLNSAGIYKHALTPYTQNPSSLKQLIVSKPGDFDGVMHQLMQNPPAVSFKLKQAQEQQLIAQAEQTQKMIDQVVTLNRIYTPDTFARLTKSVEAPTLILWGRQDKIINVEAANELKTLLKRAEAPVILNNVGHVPIIEAERAVADHYLPFLAKSQKFKNPLMDKLIPLN